MMSLMKIVYLWIVHTSDYLNRQQPDPYFLAAIVISGFIVADRADRKLKYRREHGLDVDKAGRTPLLSRRTVSGVILLGLATKCFTENMGQAILHFWSIRPVHGFWVIECSPIVIAMILRTSLLRKVATDPHIVPYQGLVRTLGTLALMFCGLPSIIVLLLAVKIVPGSYGLGAKLGSDVLSAWIGVNCLLSFQMSSCGHPKLGGALAVSTCCMILLRIIFQFRVKNGLLDILKIDILDIAPSAILFNILLFSVAYAGLHFSIATEFKHSYVGITTWQDAVYFSVVTLATVGYGDALPIGPEARLACITEIGCGVALLVVAINLSSSVWLQRVQTTTNPQQRLDPSTEESSHIKQSATL